LPSLRATLTVASTIANGSDGSSTARHSVLVNSGGQLGEVILSGANTYDGLVAVDSGTLLLENNNAAGTGTGTIFVGNGGTTLANNNAGTPGQRRRPDYCQSDFDK